MSARDLPVFHTCPGPQVLSFALGVGVFGVGAWVYAVRLEHPHATLALFTPSFIHVLGMVLLVAPVARPTPRQAFALCATWVAINWLFEFGQRTQLARPISEWLQSHCGSWSSCHRSAHFFRHGTFDPLDLAAAAAGGVCAWLLLRRAMKRSASRA